MSCGFWKLRKRFNLTFAVGCLLCSVAVPQSVRTSYLPAIEFSKYDTYK